jgi:hypothetical protein
VHLVKYRRYIFFRNSVFSAIPADLKATLLGLLVRRIFFTFVPRLRVVDNRFMFDVDRDPPGVAYVEGLWSEQGPSVNKFW